MQANQAPPVMPETPPAQPEAEATTPRVYDCAGCRYVDAHGLVCDVCLRKILDSQVERKASLIAACCHGRGCLTLLRGKRPALV